MDIHRIRFKSIWPFVVLGLALLITFFILSLKTSQQMALLSEQEAYIASLHASQAYTANEIQEAEKLKKARKALESNVGTTTTVTGILVAISFVLAAWLAYIISKNISKQIKFMRYKLSEIVSGKSDLTDRVEVRSDDELGHLAQALNDFIEHLQHVMTSIRENAAELSTLTGTALSSTSHTQNITDTLHTATESIIAAVGEMNVAQEEMSRIAQDSATGASTSTQLANEGIQVVGQSNMSIGELAVQMDDALNCVGELEKSSDDISSVVDVILGIAEQTNLLALNAAIEAARAGEQGRGFAVVADEVRTLATRTQESTSHIRTIIEQLVSNVEQSTKAITHGKELADQTVEAFQLASGVFNDLQASSEQVAEMSSQAASATSQQLNVAEGINESISGLNAKSTSIDEIADNNQRLSHSLEHVSERLSGIVGQFKV